MREGMEKGERGKGGEREAREWIRVYVCVCLLLGVDDCACVYMYIYTYVHIRMYIRTYLYTYAITYSCMHERMRILINVPLIISLCNETRKNVFAKRPPG